MVGELKELENTACGWKSSNFEQTTNVVKIQKITFHAHKTGVLTSTSVFLNMEVPVPLGLLQKE